MTSRYNLLWLFLHAVTSWWHLVSNVQCVTKLAMSTVLWFYNFNFRRITQYLLINLSILFAWYFLLHLDMKWSLSYTLLSGQYMYKLHIRVVSTRWTISLPSVPTKYKIVASDICINNYCIVTELIFSLCSRCLTPSLMTGHWKTMMPSYCA